VKKLAFIATRLWFIKALRKRLFCTENNFIFFSCGFLLSKIEKK